MKSEAYDQGNEAYHAWFEKKRSTTIDGTGPSNPYSEGSQEHEDWDDGRYAAYNECVLVEMGR